MIDAAITYKLDNLLAEWFVWRRDKDRRKVGRGFPSTDGTSRDYRTPGHWDWKNGAQQARADEIELAGIDAAIERVPNAPRPWNTAIHIHAMNLVSPHAVWTSPRLPANSDERDVLMLEAMAKLMTELHRAGVLV
ncbi:MAG TPA: hypothetical protein VD932_05450 [Aquabacterium sp.]|nr:hypothetical protein [Aquabacterium sp.]